MQRNYLKRKAQFKIKITKGEKRMLKDVLNKKLQELNLENLELNELDETLACGIGASSECYGSGSCGTKPPKQVPLG